MCERSNKKMGNWLFSVMIAFLLGFFLFNDLDIRYIYGYMLLGAVLVGFLIKSAIDNGFGAAIKIRISSMRVLYASFSLLVVLFALLPNSNKEHEAMSIMISMVIFAAYFLLAEPGKKEIKWICIAVQAVSILFSVYIIYMTLNPQVFMKYIYPRLSSVSQASVDELMPLGYGAQIGGTPSYAIYVISFALFMNEAKVMVGKARNFKQTAYIVISTVLYLTAILLVNLRAEMLAILATAFVLFVISLFFADKKSRLYRMGAIAAIIVVQIVVLILLVPTGKIDRHINTVNQFLPDGFKIGVSVQVPSENIPDNPIATTPSVDVAPPEKPSVDTNKLTSGRFALWKKALELFEENPVFGIGWKQFVNNNTYKHNVHNTYLQWLCESGIVGFVLLFLLYVSMYLLTLIRTVRQLRARDKVPYFVKEISFVSLGVQTLFAALHLMNPTFYHLFYFVFFSVTVLMIETSMRLEDVYTGEESDCLRKKIFAKKEKRMFFR